MNFPGSDAFGPFDFSSQLDIASDEARISVIRLLCGHFDLTKPDDLRRAAITGAFVGVVQAALIATRPDHQKQMVQNLSDALPWAANYAREAMNLPPLKDN